MWQLTPLFSFQLTAIWTASCHEVIPLSYSQSLFSPPQHAPIIYQPRLAPPHALSVERYRHLQAKLPSLVSASALTFFSLRSRSFAAISCRSLALCAASSERFSLNVSFRFLASSHAFLSLASRSSTNLLCASFPPLLSARALAFLFQGVSPPPFYVMFSTQLPFLRWRAISDSPELFILQVHISHRVILGPILDASACKTRRILSV